MTSLITESQYKSFQDLYCYYNENLFEGKLPDCQINLCRKKDTPGFFTTQKWIDSDLRIIHEINLNPLDLEKETIEWHGILVHYMVHLWQCEFGTPPQDASYHNKEFVKKMEEIGFIVEYIESPNGEKTGRKISWLPDPVGLFYRIHNNLPPKKPEYQPLPDMESTKANKRAKTTYTCTCCGITMWGKPEVLLICFECFELFIPQGGKSEKENPHENNKREEAAKKVTALLKKEKNRLFLIETEENKSRDNTDNEK